MNILGLAVLHDVVLLRFYTTAITLNVLEIKEAENKVYEWILGIE